MRAGEGKGKREEGNGLRGEKGNGERERKG